MDVEEVVKLWHKYLKRMPVTMKNRATFMVTLETKRRV